MSGRAHRGSLKDRPSEGWGEEEDDADEVSDRHTDVGSSIGGEQEKMDISVESILKVITCTCTLKEIIKRFKCMSPTLSLSLTLTLTLTLTQKVTSDAENQANSKMLKAKEMEDT